MSGDIFQKPTPGRPFVPNARQFSAFIDAAVAAQQGKRPGQLGGGVTPSPGIVYVRNETSNDLPPFSVLSLGDAVFDADGTSPFFGKVILQGGEPETGKFCVTLGALGDGQIGPAVAVGVVQVLVDDGDGDFADADLAGATTHLIRRGSGPARILWVSETEHEESGRYWAIVSLGNVPGSSEDSLGLQPGTDGCKCSDCYEGVSSTDCEGCGCVNRGRKITPPELIKPNGEKWAEGSTPRQMRKKFGECAWYTGKFSGPKCVIEGEGEEEDEEVHDDYRWKTYQVAADPESGTPACWKTELEWVPREGQEEPVCKLVKVEFSKDATACDAEGADCLCPWIFKRGIFENLRAPQQCKLCVTPAADGTACCGLRLVRITVNGGMFDGVTEIRENEANGIETSCFYFAHWCSGGSNCLEDGPDAGDECGAPDDKGPPYGEFRAPFMGDYVAMYVYPCWGDGVPILYLASICPEEERECPEGIEDCEEDEKVCPRPDGGGADLCPEEDVVYSLTPAEELPAGQEVKYPMSLDVVFLRSLPKATSSGHPGGSCAGEEVPPCQEPCVAHVYLYDGPGVSEPTKAWGVGARTGCDSENCHCSGFQAYSNCMPVFVHDTLGPASAHDVGYEAEVPCEEGGDTIVYCDSVPGSLNVTIGESTGTLSPPAANTIGITCNGDAISLELDYSCENNCPTLTYMTALGCGGTAVLEAVVSMSPLDVTFSIPAGVCCSEGFSIHITE